MDEDLENLELFIQEVEESLELLESGLLELEQKGRQAEIIDSVFRAAHTIKGGARLMGFPNIEKLSHYMEESLDKVRAGDLGLNSAMISLLLKGADAIRTGTSHLMEHQEESQDVFESLLEELAACARGELSDVQPVEEKQEEPSEELDDFEEQIQVENSEEEWDSEGDWEDEQIAVPQQIIDQSKAEAVSNDTQSSSQKSRVKIDVESLDKIMNLIGELVLCRNQLIQLTQNDKNPSVHTTVSAISAITSELQERVMDTRMLQVGTLFSRYHRVVRDLSQKLNKKVQLVIENQDAELDRNMLEALKDPLSHLVNNAMDHALEPPEERKNNNKSLDGKIILNSYHEGGQVVIEVRDDGRGFDIDKIKKRLVEKSLESEEVLSKMKDEDVLQRVFQPGFSTLEEATMVSGRGVGLDVVKSNITSIGGQVTIQSNPGEGSIFKLHIPLTLAVIPAITVETDDQIFAIPQSNLQELICLDRTDFDKIENVDNVETYRLRGHLLPLIRLRELIGSEEDLERQQCFILVLICGDQRFGLVVDEIRDMEEIVVKPLSIHLKSIDLFLGATLLGNGDIALILDVVGVGAKKNVNPTDATLSNTITTFRTKAASSALLFTVGGSETFAIQMSQVRRLEEINKSDIEYTGHRQVIQYRGGIMPLIELHEFIDVDHVEIDQEEQNLIVVGYKGKEVALKVNQIVDSIVFEGELNTTVVEDPCVLGTMMIQDQPFLLIDAIQIFDLAFQSHLETKAPKREERILYVDDSSFFLKVVRKYLDEAGYDTVTEISSPEALKMVNKQHFDLLLVDLEMPEINGFEFIEKVKDNPETANIPIVVLSSVTSEEDKEHARQLGVQDYLVKIDKEELLSTVEKQLAKEVVLA